MTSPTPAMSPATEPIPALSLATAPIPVLADRTSWRETFVSLRSRNYRIFTASNVVAMVSIWVQRIAQDWLVLELTGSVTVVGFMVAAQCAPMLLFGLHGGVIVDRYSTRKLLITTQTLMVVLSFTLAAVTLGGVVEVWHVFVIAFLMGTVTAVDNPSRQVFPTELVGAQHMANAISLNSSIYQLGGLIGPALSGLLLVTVGSGWSFAINGFAAVFVVITLLMLRPAELHPRPRAPRMPGQVIEGLAYIVAKPRIRITFVMVAVLAVFALPLPVVLTAYANTVFGVGAGGYGLFNSLVAVGAVIGALASTRRRSVQLRRVIFTAGMLGVLYVVASVLGNEMLFGAALITVGLAQLLIMTEANALIQGSTNLHLRGRVMSMWSLLVIGGQALGGPLLGWLAETFGAPIGLATAGSACLVASVVIALAWSRGRFRVAIDVRPLGGVVRIVERH